MTASSEMEAQAGPVEVIQRLDNELETLLVKLLEQELALVIDDSCDRRNAVKPGHYDEHERKMLTGQIKMGLHRMILTFKTEAHKVVGQALLDAYTYKRYQRTVEIDPDELTPLPIRRTLPMALVVPPGEAEDWPTKQPTSK